MFEIDFLIHKYFYNKMEITGDFIVGILIDWLI